jgi:hypothetical protein
MRVEETMAAASSCPVLPGGAPGGHQQVRLPDPPVVPKNRQRMTAPQAVCRNQEAILGEANAHFLRNGGSVPAVRVLVQLHLEVEGCSEVAEGVECSNDLLGPSLEAAVMDIREHPCGRVELLGLL